MADVIRGYTTWAAYAEFEDQRKGTLAPGMLADLVVLASDVFTRLPGKSTDVVVTATVFDGKIVYEQARR